MQYFLLQKGRDGEIQTLNSSEQGCNIITKNTQTSASDEGNDYEYLVVK